MKRKPQITITEAERLALEVILEHWMKTTGYPNNDCSFRAVVQHLLDRSKRDETLTK